MNLNDVSTPQGKTRRPRFNPFWELIETSYIFLNESDRGVSQANIARLARCSTIQALAAFHTVANSLLSQADATFDRRWTLHEKFSKLIKDRGFSALPDDDEAILFEIDEVNTILNFPDVAEAAITQTAEGKSRVEFERTALKKFNCECVNWVSEYAACVLILGMGFISRLFYDYCEYDRDMVEAALGHHEMREDSYYVAIDSKQLESIKSIAEVVASSASLDKKLTSERWHLSASMLRFDFY